MKKILLGSILHMTKGKKPKEQAVKQEADFLPYVDIKAFEKRIIDNYASPEKCLLCQDGDVLIVCDGARSGLVGRAMAGVVGSTLALISADGCSNNYLFYFLQSLYVLLNTKQKGTGTPHLNPDILKKAQLVVPSLPEQERIVAKIEELFSQLDSAVAELKSVKEKLAIYRQAVLKEAFVGNQHNGQQFCRVIDFADVQTGATPLTSRSDFYGGHIPWISSGKVNEEKIYEPSDWITELAIKETNCKIFPAHTILVAMYGEGKTRGKCAELMIAAATNQALAAIILKKDSCIIKEFLLLFLKYMYQEIRRKAVGGVQPNLNLTAVKNIEIPLFDKAKQEEIVMLIDEKLSICNNIEQTVNTALQQAAALRQSILKQAFEGNL